MVKNPLPMQDTQVWSLDRKDPLEEENATHSRILAWKIPWTEEPGGLQSMGSQRVGRDLATKTTSTTKSLPLIFLNSLWQWNFQWSYFGILKPSGGSCRPIKIDISSCLFTFRTLISKYTCEMNLSNWNILHHGHCNSRLLSVIFCYFCRYLQLLRLYFLDIK